MDIESRTITHITNLAGDAASLPDLSSQTTHGTHNRFEAQPTRVYPNLVIRLQVEAPNRLTGF